MKISEEELIDGCIEGNAHCQEQLYKIYSKKMLGVCLRYAKNEDEAADIFQEAFIKVFRYIKDFRRECPLEAWIRKIMVNTALKFLRKSINKYEHVDIETVHNLSDNAFESATSKMNRDDMMKLIEQLPVGYRTVFNLYAFEGFSHREIANQLDISENTSKSQLSRARKYLQNLIYKSQESELTRYE